MRFDVRRLELPHLTIAVLVTLSVSALAADIQDVRVYNPWRAHLRPR
ncbi:MAG: hypothetical protein R2710_11805 [Acidimicrobiales bacterium]